MQILWRKRYTVRPACCTITSAHFAHFWQGLVSQLTAIPIEKEVIRGFVRTVRGSPIKLKACNDDKDHVEFLPVIERDLRLG